jgi:hypothetical protein
MGKPPPKEAPLAGSLPPPPADAATVKGSGQARITSKPEAQTVFASNAHAATLAPQPKQKTRPHGEEEIDPHAATLAPGEIDPHAATLPPERPKRR